MKQHLAAVALVSLVLAGCDSQTSAELNTPAQKASYGIGLNMGKSLAQEGMDDLDSQAVAQGIEDAIGKKEQKLKDDELVEAFAALQKPSPFAVGTLVSGQSKTLTGKRLPPT